MDIDKYAELAMRTSVHHSDIREMLLNASLGLAGEAGEFCDKVKKILYHDHRMTNSSLIEELGDCLWYIAQACRALGTSMNSAAEANIKKLRKRYPEGFSSEGSINREIFFYQRDKVCWFICQNCELVLSFAKDMNIPTNIKCTGCDTAYILSVVDGEIQVRRS